MPQTMKKTTATAAMTAGNYTPPKRNRAGHGRHAGDRPTETSSGGVMMTKTGNDKQRERDQGRRNKASQQTATRKFIAGEQHPAAASHLDKPINVSPTAGMPYFMTKSMGGDGQQHATA